jgi:hypothetical protein
VKQRLGEIGEELKTVLSGGTLDALLPPILFAILNGIWGLEIAVIVALGLALILAAARLFRGEAWQYALGGVLMVALAAGLALLTRRAASFYIPAMVTTGLLVLLSLISLIAGKPLAAWASHLTRGWPLAWFWREDVKPAYREVTLAWMAFFTLQLVLQLRLYLRGDAAALAWANILLGWPVTVVVLVLSYLYGVWRLRKLEGPGVDEFKDEKDPPWDGQTRGF